MAPFSDYSSMEQEINNAPKPHILPRGKEVLVRIVRVQDGISNKDGSDGALWHMPYFDCPNDPLIKEFNAFIWDPLTKDKITDPKRQTYVFPDFRDFCKCFGIDYSKPFSWQDDLPGKRGWLIPGVVVDDQYGEKNTVQKYVLGPAQSGGAAVGTTGGAVNPSDVPF